ncbi:MAG: GDSL-type esterase/lipase family protein [Sedimenticola sp.]
MESDIRDMKTTLITRMDQLTHYRSFSGAVSMSAGKASNNRPHVTDENVIGINTVSSSTTPASNAESNLPPAVIERACQLSATNVQHEIPVVIGARPQIVPPTPDLSLNVDLNEPPSNTHQHSATGSTSPKRSGKILLIGDSILNGVNPKGLHWNLHKHATSGATVAKLVEEIAMYDIKLFSHVVIYIGGNDAANHIDLELFEEKLDQLVSLIKCANGKCNVVVCKVAPRGDVNVQDINTSIGRLVEHWKQQKVQCCDCTHDLFLDKTDRPAPRYYSIDGIHLSHSGTKRLLDAINRSCEIVIDYNMCIYSPKSRFNGTAQSPMSASSPQDYPRPYSPYSRQTPQAENRSPRFPRNTGYRDFPSQNRESAGDRLPPRLRTRYRMQCYQCNMIGHKMVDCWNL